jgi:DNA (cytosine-5)-methyltransferase 1
MKSLELFSGAGGLAKGLELAGLNHVALVEFNPYAYASLCENFDPKKVFLKDVREFDFSQFNGIDIIAGGPPCQPFSLGGKHQAAQDSRDRFPDAIRSIEQLQPKAFIFENVKGLLRRSFADYFEYLILRLTYPSFTVTSTLDWQSHLNELRLIQQSSIIKPQYQVQFKLINAANYGVPQTRERVIIVGIRSDLNLTWSFPKKTHSADRLLWELYITEDYWKRHNIKRSQRPIAPQKLNAKIQQLKSRSALLAQRASQPLEKPWQTLRDAIGHLPAPQSNHGIPDHLFRDGARSYPGHTGSPFDAPAKTLKAGDHGVPGGENMIRFPNGELRYLTVFESKRLQTFPDNFVIQGGWGESMRQLGNAVPVRLAEHLGQALLQTLNGDNDTSPVEPIDRTSYSSPDGMRVGS